ACNAGAVVPTAMPSSSAPTVQTTQAPSNTQAAAATQAAPTYTGPTTAPNDAETMLNSVVDHYKAVGREQALQDFTEKKPPFNNPNLLVICLGADHTMTANGEYPMLVGLSADVINGPGGKPMGQEVWDVASAVPSGTVPVKFDNPLTGKTESKILYYQKLDEDVCSVAANNPQ
ncbi:MAG TPA: hypothetical protein VMJ64_03605, partial [Anaerolineales bacterium]|nr:hypothetical protein [Anaerolineales bacterium]